MEPVGIIAFITTGIPFVTAAFKKVFETDQAETLTALLGKKVA